jgi:hypothetical protein
MIHPITNAGTITYSLSASGVWRPGSYATAKAARMAQRLDDVALGRLQGMANERAGGTGGVITEDDLKKGRSTCNLTSSE